MDVDTTRRIEDLKMYYLGIKEGVQMFAHWKDGVQYVGTTGKTLTQAIKDLNQEEEHRIGRIMKGVE